MLGREDDASWIDVSDFRAHRDVGFQRRSDRGSCQASRVFGVGSGLETDAFHDGITYDLSIPNTAPDAPDMVSGLQVTTDAVQGCGGYPVTPAAVPPTHPRRPASPQISIASPAVVNIQQVTISPRPNGAVGYGQEGICDGTSRGGPSQPSLRIATPGNWFDIRLPQDEAAADKSWPPRSPTADLARPAQATCGRSCTASSPPPTHWMCSAPMPPC